MTSFSFKPATTRYEPQNALWLGKAAKLAYEDKAAIESTTATWGFNKCHFFDKRETQAYAIANDKIIIVAFRGTEPKKLQDWMTDADLDLVDGMGGKVHEGFSRALTYVYQDILDKIAEFQTKGQSLWFTGHSLGGSLATLAVAKLRYENDKPIYGLYTFGQPRVGNRDFERTFNSDFKPRAFRFVNNNDVVPRIPLRLMKYSHVGTFIFFDNDGNIHSDIGWWYSLLDNFTGRIEDFLKPGTDGIKDHDMEKYVANLEKNINIYPKL